MKRVHNPPHPGLLIREDVLSALGLNTTQAAEQRGFSRMEYSRMINGHAAISMHVTPAPIATLDVNDCGYAAFISLV